MPDGYGFNPREVNHRTLLRQKLLMVGSRETTDSITRLLDYVDELEQRHVAATDRIVELKKALDAAERFMSHHGANT